MTHRKDPKVVMARCEKLMALGFEPDYEDARVYVPCGIEKVEVDFSVIDSEKFAEYALRKVYEAAFSAGKRDMQRQFRDLIGAVEDVQE